MFAWTTLGLAISLLMALTALTRRSGTSRNYYEADVYGMTPAVHSRYSLAGFVLAALFALAYFLPPIPVVPLLAVAVLVAIFYFTSFLRGFSDEE
jgi:hypothetical protein